jgi:hypothetical protein
MIPELLNVSYETLQHCQFVRSREVPDPRQVHLLQPVLETVGVFEIL